MSEELFGLIFISVWLSFVIVCWYFCIFRGYDKVWSERITEFQMRFAFFELYRRFVKAWNSPIMVRIFLIVGFYALYIATIDFMKSN
jgi:hypothetical protein